MKKRKLSLWLTLGCRKLHIEENHSPLKVVHRAEKPVQKVEQAFFFSPEKTRAGEYRYGFNGMEKDDELKGQGNSYDFGARMYDARIGRWMSLDPLASKYEYLTPYNFVANSPLLYVDPDGKEIRINYINSNGESAFVVYKAGMVDETGNNFVKETIMALDHLGDNSDLAKERIDIAINTTRVVEIEFTPSIMESSENTESPDDNSKITWSNIETDNYDDGSSTPAIALFDEIDHFAEESKYLEAIDDAKAEAESQGIKPKKHEGYKDALEAWNDWGSLQSGGNEREENRQFENEKTVSADLGVYVRKGANYYEQELPSSLTISKSSISSEPASNPKERKKHFKNISKNGQGS